MTNYYKLSDSELLNLLKGGDTDAFRPIYDHYWPLLVRHASRLVSDGDLIEDALQDVFTKFLEQIQKFEIKNLSAYLYRATKNQILNLIKEGKTEARHLESIAAYNPVDQDADEYLLFKELQRIIDEEVDRMPPRMKEIYLLSRDERLSNKEIAKFLKLSDHTIHNQIKKALKRLRDNPNINIVLISIMVSFMLNKKY